MKLTIAMGLQSLALVTGAILAGQVNAQQLCDGTIPSSAPSHRFVVNSDGTVFDARTSLTWMRCAIGSELDDNDTPTVFSDDRCVTADTELFRWEDAFSHASDLNATGGFAGRSDWRLPNIKELMSLVERQCVSPAINASVFPDSVTETQFWSSTPDVIVSAYIIDFRDGTQDKGRRLTATHRLRLVR